MIQFLQKSKGNFQKIVTISIQVEKGGNEGTEQKFPFISYFSDSLRVSVRRTEQTFQCLFTVLGRVDNSMHHTGSSFIGDVNTIEMTVITTLISVITNMEFMEREGRLDIIQSCRPLIVVVDTVYVSAVSSLAPTGLAVVVQHSKIDVCFQIQK